MVIWSTASELRNFKSLKIVQCFIGCMADGWSGLLPVQALKYGCIGMEFGDDRYMDGMEWKN
jgi:hypothetical protein